MEKIKNKTKHFFSRDMSHSRNGQSLAEVLIAVAVGVVLIGAAVSPILPSLKSSVQVSNIQTGSTFAQGLLDNTRVFSETNWNNFLALATGSANAYFFQTAKSPLAIATGTESMPYDSVTSGLLGWWKMDDGYGSTTVDSSINANTGTWNGTPAGSVGTYYTVGHLGQYAGDFDGSTDYVKSQNNISLTGDFTGTISLWVQFQSTSTGWHALADFGQTGADQGFGIFQGPAGAGSVSIGFYGSHRCDTAVGIVTPGQWYHLVATKTPGAIGATTTALYLNDVSQSLSCNTSNVPNALAGFLYIGSDAASEFSNSASIDDVRVYNRALTSGEITQIYSDFYKRNFYLSDVYRTTSGTVTTGGGTYDPSTKQVTVVYSWPGGTPQTISTFLTRNQNNVIDQTDWSGGGGQNGPMTSTNNKFATSSNIDYSTTTGSFYLPVPGY